jgi:hypothetical protein
VKNHRKDAHKGRSKFAWREIEAGQAHSEPEPIPQNPNRKSGRQP